MNNDGTYHPRLRSCNVRCHICRKAQAISGMDDFAEQFRKVSDNDFFKEILGKSNAILEEFSIFQGKDVPCLT